MNTISEQQQPGEAANAYANGTQETGAAIRVRLGVQPRTFQKVWKRTFGYAFESGRIVTDAERAAMEAKYLVAIAEKPAPKTRAKREPKQVEIPVPDAVIPVVETAKQFTNSARKFAAGLTVEVFAAWAMFLTPTIASIRNTVSVSGAFSGDYTTSLLITATISGTGILWIASRKKITYWDMSGILIFQFFEGFCNMVQVYKNLMATMQYGMTMVTGKPSELLDMVATLTNRDHRDTALILCTCVAAFILFAQIKGLLLIKQTKQQ